jgi:methylamine--corrinoid protein Co-methyltransferase
MKMDMTGLNMLAGWSVNGDTIMTEQMPIFGGYCGGVEETAICDLATTLASFVMFGSHIHLDGPIHIRWGVTTARETLQISSHVGAALDLNTDLLLSNQYYPLAGPCTEMCLLETAAQAIADTASGRELISGSAASKGVARDKSTPLEARIMGEAAIATTGMKIPDVNEILDNLIRSYEADFPNPPKSKRFQDCFDLKTITPTDEYLGVYENSLNILNDLGIIIKY